MARYTGIAPGDTLELVGLDEDTFITDPILKIFFLEVIPLIIAAFIVVLFLIVCITGVSAVGKSVYYYKIRPAVKKRYKVYKRYRRKMHTTDDANSSSSSSSEEYDDDVLPEYTPNNFELLNDQKNTDSLKSFFPGHHESVMNLRNSDLNAKPNSSQQSIHPNPHHHHHRHHRHHQRGTELNRILIQEPLEALKKTTAGKKAQESRRYANTEIMPEHFRHLRRLSAGPAQRALSPSPDFQAFNPKIGTWFNEDIVIRTKKMVNQRKSRVRVNNLDLHES